MTSIKDIARQVKDTPFLEEVLEEFVARGLGSLPGKETTIALISLLLKHHPVWRKNPPEDYEIARLLRTSPRKIRNIRDELSYRDTGRDDGWCKARLIEVLMTAERIHDGKFMTFQIDDGLVRDFAQKLVRRNFGVFESGMNAAVVKISGGAFAALVIAVMPEKQRKELLLSVSQAELESHQDKRKTKTPIRLFVESFAAKAGEEAGRQSVDLAFTLLTGGLNKVSGAIGMVRKLFED